LPLEVFRESEPLSLGIELELQILATHDYDLTRGAPDLIELLARRAHTGEVKPEITESMIEISTGIHTELPQLVAEMRQIRDELVQVSDRLNLVIAGGGAHPFMHWNERKISETPRFQYLSELYGYLVKQFTVFGQHVHVGCRSGDEALYLLHSLSRYVPHFVALAASSPFYQGAETGFDSSRLNSVFAFPLSGRAPTLLRWSEFETYFGKMEARGIVKSMKDFYWDIRPKPEFGTIEVRVCDTPLTVERAAVLAAYLQALSRYLLLERPHRPQEDDYLVYTYNRFTACRFGLEAFYIDPGTGERGGLAEHVLLTLDAIAPHAAALDSAAMLDYLRDVVQESGNDARWIRATHRQLGSFPQLMRAKAKKWREKDELLAY
jgi:glutamate---cysteine ligase / carboxylate-amine ligase